MHINAHSHYLFLSTPPPSTTTTTTLVLLCQGCNEKDSADLLLQLAELVGAIAAQTSTDDALGVGPQRLLDAACAAGGRLWSESMQLFPRDMARHLLEEYG